MEGILNVRRAEPPNGCLTPEDCQAASDEYKSRYNAVRTARHLPSEYLARKYRRGEVLRGDAQFLIYLEGVVGRQPSPPKKSKRDQTSQDTVRAGEYYRAPNDPRMAMFAGTEDEEHAGFLAGCSYGKVRAFLRTMLQDARAHTI